MIYQYIAILLYFFSIEIVWLIYKIRKYKLSAGFYKKAISYF